MIKYDDNSIIPFGKHKNVKLANVPADYLMWLEDEIAQKPFYRRSIQEKGILSYIRDNRAVLEKEIKEAEL